MPIREQTPSPEDGMTDDLCGLHMSAKKGRELGHAMGFSADHLTNKVCTGSIQRQQSKDKIARNTVDFKSSKSKASIAMRSSSHTKSPKLADHFGFFAMPGETQEDFSQSHFTIKERHNPDTSVPGIYNGHAIVRITVCKTGKDGVLKSEQFSCACKRDIQSPEYDRTSQLDASSSPDPTKGRLGGRTCLFKTPNMIVAFLCSLARNENT